MSDVKHRQMARKFEVVARKVEEFQTATTWTEPIDQMKKPKFQLFLVAYDKLVPQNFKLEKTGWGSVFFQVSEDFDVVSMGKKFQKIGHEMQQGGRSGTNWNITEDIKEFHHFALRTIRFSNPGRQQTSKNPY